MQSDSPPEPYLLTDLQSGQPGVRRLAHGYATSGTWRRLLQRGGTVLREVAYALPRDLAYAVRRGDGNLLRVEAGIDPGRGAERVAIYVHYAPTGQVSDMVQGQVRQLVQDGFAVVFVTMAPGLAEADWQVMRTICARVVQRRNFGLDFGALHDLVPLVRQSWPGPEELMLANDSVLGPIYPLPPVLQALRSGGDGLFGLTESLQGGAHLQSYMLLARGQPVIADLLNFLDRLFISHSKWLLVQVSEIRLARWMAARGHRVAALFGYDRLIRAALAHPAERRRLAASHVKLAGLDQLPDDRADTLLRLWPLNPTQHMWHLLATRFQTPYLKTELVRRNPGRLPDVDTWPTVVPRDSPCPLAVLQAHLAAMGR